MHLRPTGTWRVSHDEAGLALLAALGYPLAIIKARQARNFARAANQLAKTDKVDAKLLAGFGEAMPPPLRALASKAQQQLQE